LYETEPEINVSRPLLQQRNYWYQQDTFSKPLLTKVPIRYTVGHHGALNRVHGPVEVIDQNLVMIHLHSFDNNHCFERERAKFEGSVKNHKADEETLGMNSRAHGTSLDPYTLTQWNVCGLTMMMERKDGQVLAPDGKIATPIPKQFKSVDI
jgi:hypothetical protein